MIAANDNEPTEKQCASCKVVKPLNEFHSQPSGKYGRHSYCAECACAKQRETRVRKYNPEYNARRVLKSRYGLTPEQWSEMLSGQGGLCAICRTEPARPCVDHNHETGVVRGILCHRCNIGLPYVEDSAYRAGAIEYLNRYEALAA